MFMLYDIPQIPGFALRRVFWGYSSICFVAGNQHNSVKLRIREIKSLIYTHELHRVWLVLFLYSQEWAIFRNSLREGCADDAG
jgi:hypothetical protein